MPQRTMPYSIHGRRDEEEHEVYDMPTPPGATAWWDAVTDVPCPVAGCGQTLLWYEAGYVPGYRICMAPAPGYPGQYDYATRRHRFLAGAALGWGQILVHDECCEQDLSPRDEDEGDEETTP